MEKLSTRMKMDMELRNFSPRTIKTYLWHIENFEQEISRPAEQLTQDNIRRYLYYLKTEKKYGRSYLSQAFSALKYLYKNIFDMPMALNELHGPKREKRLPIILTRQELKRLFSAVDNLKYRCVMMVGYSAGLRINEALHVKVSDIDSERMQIRVNQGKGHKDRYTLLSKVLLKELGNYYKIYKPYQWLFPGRTVYQHLGASPIQKEIKTAKKSPNTQNGNISYPEAHLCDSSFRTGCGPTYYSKTFGTCPDSIDHDLSLSF